MHSKSAESQAIVDVQMLSDEEFFKQLKERRKDLSDAVIRRGRAYHFEEGGVTRIWVRSESMPEEFLPYIIEHERAESHVARKTGFNLCDRARNSVARVLRKQIPKMGDKSIDQIWLQLSNEYNFDFKHEWAIYKEYKKAKQEGRLEEYHDFLMKFRMKDLKDFDYDPQARRKTLNDMRIRSSVHEKLKSGASHYFMRDLPLG